MNKTSHRLPPWIAGRLSKLKAAARNSTWRFYGVLGMSAGALLWALMLTVLDNYNTSQVLLWVGALLFAGGFVCWEIGFKKAGYSNAGPEEDDYIDNP